MSVDKLVDSTQLDADLTSVANAIRTKGGTSASLAFPADFLTAIAAIPTGGGGSFKTGTFTPATTGTSATIPIGGSYDNFAIYYSSGPNPNSERHVRGAFCDFARTTGKCVFVATTNNTGGSTTGFYNASGWFTQDGDNIEYASQSNSTKLLSTQVYTWVAW